MFVDYVNIKVRSGDGGEGLVAFRREKFVPKGTPNGGDGGRGGDVIFECDGNLNTLMDFTYHREFLATDGKRGGSNMMTGKNGKSVVITVPLGTLIKDSITHEVLADMSDENDRVILLKGGVGGLGNYHFKTSTNQAPRYTKPAKKGHELSLNLELKILADVGLVGFPNAGKSTLLSVLSNARPKIADYPFTTLVPNLGIVKFENYKSFVMADIPGLIEGASRGKGLGFNFLRHVERTKVLIYMISSESEDFERDFNILQQELFAHDEKMREKPFIKVLTKLDILDEEREFDSSFFDLEISSFAQIGLKELKLLVSQKLRDLDKVVF